jgi:putative PIN family toxin of toxin-antitoxin system
MRLVLDSNIFISAFYWGGNPQKVIDRIIENLDELYISDDILNEIAKTMARPKFNTGPEIIDRFISTIEKTGKKVFISGKMKVINTAGQTLHPPPTAVFRGKPRSIKPFDDCACSVMSEQARPRHSLRLSIKNFCRDKDDDAKIECGVLSFADYLITGDEDLLILKNYKHLKIITAKEYLDLISTREK